MGHYLHKISKQEFKSISPTRLLALGDPITDYIDGPDLSIVDGQPTKYWVIPLTGKIITLADQSTRDAIDVTELDTQKDSVVAQLDADLSIIKALFLVVLDEFNVLRAEHGLAVRTVTQMKTAVKGEL